MDKRCSVVNICSVFFLAVIMTVASLVSNNITNRIVLGGININMILYATIFITFFAFYFVMLRLVKKRDIKDTRLFLVVSLIVVCLWIVCNYFSDRVALYDKWESLLTYETPWFVYFLVIVLTSFFVQRMVTKETCIKFPLVVKIFSYILYGIVVFALVYAPNPFLDKMGGIYHVDAYTNSIYNTFRLIPFDDINTSIYGKHALIYLLPVKFLSCFVALDTAVNISIAFLTVLTFLMFVYVLRKKVHSSITFVITAVASIYPMVWYHISGQYYQIIPQRLFFPILILFVEILMEDANSVAKHIIESVVVVLSVIWNPETAVACTLVYAGIYVYDLFGEEISVRLNKRNIYKLLMLIVNLGLIAFLPYCFVNIYNILVGGRWIDLLTFLYPIGSKTWDINALSAPLPSILDDYYIYILVCFVGMGSAFVAYISKKRGEVCKWIILCSIEALALMVYYINAPINGKISIAFLQLILILAISIDCMMRDKFNDDGCIYKKRWICVPFIILISFFATVVCELGNALIVRFDTVYNTKQYESTCRAISDDLGDNEIMAVGIGTQYIFARLNKDVLLHVIDTPDMKQREHDLVEQELHRQNEFFVNVNYVINYEWIDEYSLAKQYYLDGDKNNKRFGIYIKDIYNSDIYERLLRNKLAGISYKLLNYGIDFGDDDIDTFVHYYLSKDRKKAINILGDKVVSVVEEDEYVDLLFELFVGRIPNAAEKEKYSAILVDGDFTTLMCAFLDEYENALTR